MKTSGGHLKSLTNACYMNVLDELLQHTENRALYYSSAHNDEESIIPIPSEPAL